MVRALARRMEAAMIRAESAELVEQVIGEICSTLAAGKSVKLFSFGIFTGRMQGKRIGRNPKTNVEVPIEPGQTVTFSTSHVLKAYINGSQRKPRSG